jgi:hypothetical protein
MGRRSFRVVHHREVDRGVGITFQPVPLRIKLPDLIVCQPAEAVQVPTVSVLMVLSDRGADDGVRTNERGYLSLLQSR